MGGKLEWNFEFPTTGQRREMSGLLFNQTLD